MSDPSTGSGSPRAESRGEPAVDWRRTLDDRLARLGVAPARRIAIVAEVTEHLAEAGRSTLDDDEADQLVRGLARVERRAPASVPPLGQPSSSRQAFMSTIWQDLRHAARAARLAPAYSAIVIATLALGIGANAAIFSVVDAVMLRPYYPGMDRLVMMNEATRQGDQMSVAWPTFQDWQAGSPSFEQLGVYRTTTVNLTGVDAAERLNAATASAGMFAAIGLAPLAGRTFTAAEDTPSASRVAVISERLWRRRFDADPATIGRTVVLSGDAYEIVGVMPAAMRFPSRQIDVWLPLGPSIPTFPPTRAAHPGLYVIGRLQAGVPVARAAADMDTLARRIEQAHPDTNHDVTVQLTPYFDQIVSGIRPTLFTIAGAVGFVLLIGCANLANLMLARTERRQRDVAVRAALGADRRRILQQLLAESLLLAAIGGALGLLLATWLVSLFVASGPVTVPRVDLIGVDGRVVAFTALLSIATGIVFGLVPAFKASGADLLSTIKRASRGAGAGAASRRFRSALIVVEVALALTLLVGAGLLIQSFARLMAVDTGFDPDGVVTMRLSLPPAKYRDTTHWTAFHDELVRRVAAIPGVVAAGVNSAVPLQGGGSEAGVFLEGRPVVRGKADAATLFQACSPDYFRAMRIRLVRGRYFSEHDTRESTPVVIVDDSLVRRLFGDADPIGKRISFETHGTGPGDPNPAIVWREIVGVVAHVRHYGIASEPPYVQVYTPLEQLPTYFEARHPAMALLARTAMAPEALAAVIRREAAALDPDIPVYGLQTMASYLQQNTEQPRLSAVMLAGLAALALVLAVIGIYGVVSYTVTQRTQEIGVRMALGATGRDVVRMVVGQAATLVGVGIAAGIAASLALGSTLRSLLYQVSPRDPWTMTAIAVLLAGVAIAASVIPARRATRVDPLLALRAE
jgi:putative ABC transport system permease protein